MLHRCLVFAPVKVGYRSYANDSVIREHTAIGRYCSIGRRCTIGAARHPIDWLTTHPVVLQPDIAGAGLPTPRGAEEATVIGNDVWIGDNVVIMPGVTIGDGAIIGAGAVVTRPVSPYTIVTGVPARRLRSRFPDAVVARLMALRWWDYGDELIRDLPYPDVAACLDLMVQRLESGRFDVFSPGFSP
ncbi:CatB-related O-acetyltransferase [Bosea sp. AK1]|uniref:CatB-related O-acetyltransferase n=1 Tax=Bosea sp. AK1 TaxID=2587160 RepID=UPI00163A33B8|nr:CatB-related O-acetyltransferase [Bosea sp. AK1]